MLVVSLFEVDIEISLPSRHKSMLFLPRSLSWNDHWQFWSCNTKHQPYLLPMHVHTGGQRFPATSKVPGIATLVSRISTWHRKSTCRDTWKWLSSPVLRLVGGQQVAPRVVSCLVLSFREEKCGAMASRVRSHSMATRRCLWYLTQGSHSARACRLFINIVWSGDSGLGLLQSMFLHGLADWAMLLLGPSNAKLFPTPDIKLLMLLHAAPCSVASYLSSTDKEHRLSQQPAFRPRELQGPLIHQFGSSTHLPTHLPTTYLGT